MSWRDREPRHERRPVWEPRRSPARSPVWEPRRRGERDRERDRRSPPRRRSRSPRRRRSPRRSPSPPPPPPSPPRISTAHLDMELSSDSSDHERRPRDDLRDDHRDDHRDEHRDEHRDAGLGASPGDWICKCGSYNFKRRLICYKRKCQGNRSDGVVYSGDGDKETNSGITKRLLFRRLDALTTEEKILDTLKERCSKSVLDAIAGITIGRETLTGASKCLAYINFNSIADSTAAYSELLSLNPRLKIDDRDVLITYYNEPVKLPKPSLNYSNYYGQVTNFQSNPNLSEADRVNAAAAVAQSAIASAQARQLWTPVAAPTFASSASQNSKLKIPIGDGKTKYSAPDVRTFMYDETSGYYYDPATGLYYDGTSQYFFNSQLNQYMYWDASSSTYIAATQAQQNTDQPKLPKPPEATTDNTIKVPEEKKKKEIKDDKVKVAKKIAKDMERWARTLNQKKENARNNTVMEQPTDMGPSKGSADIGFSVLGSGPSHLSTIKEREPSPPPPEMEDFLVKKTEPVNDSDDGIIDWVKLTCLLCKRKFPSVDVLMKHKNMSDLHKSNLAEFRSKEDAFPQMNGYRDRAAERRLKFGEDEPVTRKRFDPPEPAMLPIMPMPPTAVIDTIGGKMLQKMGWSEGRGLGKEEQGRIAPIEAEQRLGLAGLGQKRGIYTPTPGETYRDTVKKLMIARYKEVVGQEEGNK